MPVDVSATLRQAWARLTSDKERLDRQISALRQALDVTSSRRGRLPAGRGTGRRARKPMSAAQRKAVGARMKAYWAKRKRASKGKAGTAAK